MAKRQQRGILRALQAPFGFADGTFVVADHGPHTPDLKLLRSHEHHALVLGLVDQEADDGLTVLMGVVDGVIDEIGLESQL